MGIYDRPCCAWTLNRKPRSVTLSFKRKEIIYDAGNYSYVEGDIIPEGDECRRHQVIDIVQDGNVDRVTRVLNTAHAECVEMLYPYTKEELPYDTTTEMDDVLKEPDVYEIKMTVPDGMSKTTINLLEHLIHEYLVCRVLADWMSITNPESEGKWEKKFISLREKIRTCLVSRIGVTRRKLKPF